MSFAQFKRDSDGQVGSIRSGAIPIERISLTAANVTADTWYRLMPSGNAATKESGNQIDLGTSAIRGSLLPQNFAGWKLKILNAGYFQTFRVDRISSALLVDLGRPITLPGTPATALQWVLYPDIIQGVTLGIPQNTVDVYVDIGHAPGDDGIDEYAPSDTEIRFIKRIAKESLDTIFKYRGDDIEKLFYRYPTATGANVLEWGEFDVGVG